jgi:hypothetical protein
LGKLPELELFGEPLLAASIVAFGVIVCLAAGVYPALHLSSLVPLCAVAGSA